MSWLEPMTMQFLLSICTACICIPACKHDWGIYKTWMFASSCHALNVLGGTCQHPPRSHEVIHDVRDQWGNFISRTTACYPPALATAFADVICPLLTPRPQDLHGQQFTFSFLSSRRMIFHFLKWMGGGNISQRHWGRSERGTPDVFAFLRKSWV